MEIMWKDIAEKEGYQVSEDGRVRSFHNNRHGVCDEPHELKHEINKHGYHAVHLGRGRRRLVSRLVAEAFIPNPDNLPIVRHLDDNPDNNSVYNLAWGTQTDNMQDCVRHGRLVGDTRSAVEANKKPVVAVSLSDGSSKWYESCRAASRDLGVWPQHISNVLYGRIKQTGGYSFRYADEEDYDERYD